MTDEKVILSEDDRIYNFFYGGVILSTLIGLVRDPEEPLEALRQWWNLYHGYEVTAPIGCVEFFSRMDEAIS